MTFVSFLCVRTAHARSIFREGKSIYLARHLKYVIFATEMLPKSNFDLNTCIFDYVKSFLEKYCNIFI